MRQELQEHFHFSRSLSAVRQESPQRIVVLYPRLSFSSCTAILRPFTSIRAPRMRTPRRRHGRACPPPVLNKHEELLGAIKRSNATERRLTNLGSV